MLVVAAAFHCEKRGWLMHCRPEGKAHAGLWEFPGGKVELGEAPEIALLREIEEELGVLLDVGDLAPVGFASGPSEDANRSIVILLYKVSRWSGELTAREGGRIDWFALEEIGELAKPPLDQALLEQLKQKHGR